MAKQRKTTNSSTQSTKLGEPSPPKPSSRKFDFRPLNTAQNMAFGAFKQHDVLFLSGPAGTGKTHLSMAFALFEFLKPGSDKKKIVLTRPIVEAGEKLGFLPGDFYEKVNPYMMPLIDCLNSCVPEESVQRERVDHAIEFAPLAYLRGRTFNDSICILDEAQNATKTQLKLFLTRLGKNSKMIITGDPLQTDLQTYDSLPFSDVLNRLETVQGVGIIKFKAESIVRHPLVSAIIEKLES